MSEDKEFTFEEAIAFAETAFRSGQYAEARKYYENALREKPEDVSVLTKLGSIGIMDGDPDEAVRCFTRCTELEPGNGNHFYYLGNALYFSHQYARCLDMYTKAEELSVSPAFRTKLLFQKGLLFAAEGNPNAALVYLDKYKDACQDSTALDPRFYAEEFRLQLTLGRDEEAARTAEMLIASQPTVFENYLLYFNLLLRMQKYGRAEEILREAEETAEMTARDSVILGIEGAAFYAELSGILRDTNTEMSIQCAKNVENIYEKMLATKQLSGMKHEILYSKANLLIKDEKYEEAVQILDGILSELVPGTDLPVISDYPSYGEDFEPVEISGEDLSEMDSYAEETASDPDEDYPDLNEFDGIDSLSSDDTVDRDISSEPAEEAESAESESAVPDDEALTTREARNRLIENVRYALMSCCVSMKNCDYMKALSLARMLTDSDDISSRYFSRYCAAYCIRNLAKTGEGYTADDAVRAYDETIAFFRTCMLKDPGDRFAVILRTRMYAEKGDFYKAEELTKVLTPEERGPLSEYIELCRKEDV